MKVIVMRHGEAAGLATSQKGDRGRHLTNNGIKQAQDAGKVLAKHFNVVKVIASEYYRAAETAAEVAIICDSPLELTSDISLTDTNLEATYEKLVELNSDYDSDEAVVLVSHIPLVYLLTDLLSNNAPNSCHFHTASFVAIDLDSKKIIGNYDQEYHPLN